MKTLFKTNISAAIGGTIMTVVLFSPSALAQSPAFDLLEEGRDAYLDYNFDEAARLYAAAAKKAKKGDAEFSEEHSRYVDQLDRARNFLNRVERLEILDSIAVPKRDFLKAYRLPPSSGSLSDANGLPARFDKEGVESVFTSENGEYKIWAAPDSIGRLHLLESTKLSDGKWTLPTEVDDALSEEGDAAYPFMMADGVTLYYADNGDNSIGGYDIMVATRESTDGEFLQPQNLGMPYNSPYDDYMLAIDELTGVGWWATDRNLLDDMVTIYLFKVNDLRSNYDPDMDDLIDYARLSEISLTWEEDTDREALLREVKSIDPNARSRKADFHFPMDGGKVYTTYDDFKSASARKLMAGYVEEEKALAETEKKLTAKRKQYHAHPDKSLAREIAEMELSLEKKREALRRALSDIYRAERNR
ncbi:MAG: hypothetical protein K2M37_02285 [Muribaculaceae bacterium]|nr:hypothetical protein [Muribaculaceae bacterium]